MKRCKKMLCALLASMMMLFSGMNAIHAQDNTQSLIGDLIRYYIGYQEKANTDMNRILDEMKAADPGMAENWKQIMDYWTYAKTEMPINLGIAPDGLPQDDTLCFVVLGFQLNPDGTMQDELIGRLQVALDSANKYPNALVAVTGGGTAKDNPDATEADSMAAWLIEHGLDPSRLIVENQAHSTSENAQFTYAILKERYPQVDSLCLISSDYHIAWGSLLMNAELLLSSYETGDKRLSVDNNAAYAAGPGIGSYFIEGYQLCQIAGLNDLAAQMLEQYRNGTYEDPKLSQLTSLNVTLNEDRSIKVEAVYDSGYVQDVTALATISGYDPNSDQDQSVQAVYQENGIEKSGQLLIKGTAAQEPEKPDTSPPDTKHPIDAENVSTAASHASLPYFAIAMTALAGSFILRRRALATR